MPVRGPLIAPGLRLKIGASVLSAARAVDTRLVKERLARFEREHRRCVEAQRKVAATELRVRAAKAHLSRCDAEQEMSKRTSKAAQAAEKAARAVAEAMRRLEKVDASVRAARRMRDAIGRSWHSAFADALARNEVRDPRGDRGVPMVRRFGRQARHCASETRAARVDETRLGVDPGQPRLARPLSAFHPVTEARFVHRKAATELERSAMMTHKHGVAAFDAPARGAEAAPTTAKNAAVGVYDSHTEAEAAVKELQKSGFDMQRLSIVGREYHTEQHVVGYYNTGTRMKYWGKLGAFWGGLWGLLFGAAFFWIPGIGPILVGGPLVSAIVAALEGAAVYGGLSALGAGLYSIGIPKNSILDYETALKADKFLVIAHGTAAEMTRAREILARTHAAKLAVHSA